MAPWSPFPKSMTVAERRLLAAREVAAAKKTGKALAPVVLAGRVIAASFWGRSWCDNLERYRDFANRLERGRSYVRSGAVIDLRVERGRIEALVSGSEVYRVAITIDAVAEAHWRALAQQCAGAIDSLLELLKGRLDAAVMTRVCDKDAGLFPTPKQIHFSCSCPDIASMCKHVAAVLYGVGARLDSAPELLFVLRAVDPADLVKSASAVGSRVGRKRSARALSPESDLVALFGLDLVLASEDVVAAPDPVAAASARPGKAPGAKLAAKTKAAKSKVRGGTASKQRGD